MSSHIPRLRRHPARVIPSVLASLAIMVITGLVIWAVAAYVIEGQWPEPLASAATPILDGPLSQPAILWTAIALLLIGLVLVLCAIIPGHFRHRELNVAPNLYDGPQETVLSQHGLENFVRARTQRLSGVDSIGADATNRKLQLTVNTPLRETKHVTDRVGTVTDDALDRLPLTRRPAVRIRTGRSTR